jgi:hypothetical protein
MGPASREQTSDRATYHGRDEPAGVDISRRPGPQVDRDLGDLTGGSGVNTDPPQKNDSIGEGLSGDVRAAVAAAEDYRSSMLDDMRDSLKATLEYANGLASIHSPAGLVAHSIDETRELSTGRSAGPKEIPAAAMAAENYRTKAFDLMKTNVNATMELAQRLARARSPAEFVELTTSHARNQLETVFTQTNELALLAQKLATSNLEQMAARFSKALGGRGE